MIRFDGVTLTAWSGARILTSIDLRVAAGEIYALVGDRHTPLSVVGDALLGFARPQAGTIAVAGRRPTTHPTDVRRAITAIRWPTGLEPRLTVRANVRLVLRLAGHDARDGTRIDAALRESELPDRCFDRPAADLPPAGQCAVWLAIARLRATPVVLCDDPTVELRESETIRFAGLLRDLAASGPAILVTTSDMAFARAAADRGTFIERASHVFEWVRRESTPATAGFGV